MRIALFLVAVLVVALADAAGSTALAHGVHDTIASATSVLTPPTTDREVASADQGTARQGRAACAAGSVCCVAGCATPGILPEPVSFPSLHVAATLQPRSNEPAAGRTIEPPLDPPRHRI